MSGSKNLFDQPFELIAYETKLPATGPVQARVQQGAHHLSGVPVCAAEIFRKENPHWSF